MKKYILPIILILLGVICFVIKGLNPATIDANGFLQENFFLIPIGYILIFIGIIMGIAKYIIGNKNK